MAATLSLSQSCTSKSMSAGHQFRGKGAGVAFNAVRSQRLAPVARVGRVLTTAEAKKVVVVGAGGRTGKLVLQRLLQKPDQFQAKGLVRSEKTASKVKSDVPEAGDSDFLYGDITDSAGLTSTLKSGASGYDALVLLTSAVPKIKIMSLIVSIVTKILPGMEAKRPEFDYPAEGTPELVDWIGAKNQIDAAKAAGIKRVVFVSSMGGTQIDNFLNTMGGGNILLYKRKAEMYLMASGLEYTIIHPGGLTDKPAGEREIIVDVDDKLLERETRNIPRGDVAELAVQCISLDEAKNRSFDTCTKEGPATKDFVALIDSLGEANCDYSLPKNSPVPLP